MRTSIAKAATQHTAIDDKASDARRRDRHTRPDRVAAARQAQIATDIQPARRATVALPEAPDVALAAKPSVLHTALALFSRLRRALSAEMQRRDALHRLGALDDQTLRDIGLTRGELSYAVRHGHPEGSLWRA